MASETRIIDIPQDAVLAADVSSLVRVFSQIAAQPDDAKHVRGTIFVGFPFYEDDPRPNWAISEIRQYSSKAGRGASLLPVFLARDPALGHVLMYLLCLIPIADLEARRYSSLELMQAVKRKRAAVADFCDRIQDDADRATEPLLLNLPPTIAKADPNLVARILAVMRLPLVGLETQLAAGSVDTPEMKEHLDEVLTKATALAGLDRSSYKSDLEVLRALLARITPSVSREELSEFEQAFERALELVPGRKYKSDQTAVRKLVAEQRNAAYQFVKVHITMAASQPGYLQPAAIVAFAIRDVFDDRSALLQIERRAEELDVGSEIWMPEPD